MLFYYYYSQVAILTLHSIIIIMALRLLALCTLASSTLAFVALSPFVSSSSPRHLTQYTATSTARPNAFSRLTSIHGGAGRDMTMAAERTYIMVKPDGVQRGIVSDIISRFEKRGYQLVALKLTKPPRSLLEEHYSSLKSKPFFPKLMDYMTSGPVVAMVWQGKDVVATGRKMLGATNPLESAPGTIRGDFCIEVGRNICHGSDSVESAEREIGLWFSGDELISWASHSHDWLYE